MSLQGAPGPHTSNGRGGLGTDLQAGGEIRDVEARKMLLEPGTEHGILYPKEVSLSVACFCVRITPLPTMR